MTLLVNASDECFYIYEGAGAGHVLPPYDGPWTLLGEVVYNADVNANTIFVTRYPNLTPTGWCGLYLGANGSDLFLEVNPGTGAVDSAAYALTPGTRYPVSLHYDGAGTSTLRLDGVITRQVTGVTLPAGTTGQLSAQWAGFGAGGHTDSTWARWRMWGADLTEAECKAEHRSYTPVRTADLVSDWPMLAGATRYADTVGTNTLIPNGSVSDGSAIPLLPLADVVGESISFTEAQSGAGKFAGSQAESISFADSADASLDAPVSVEELVSLSDTISGAYVGIEVVSESIELSDSVDSATRNECLLTEQINLDDGSEASAALVSEATESITLDDSQGAAAAFQGVVDESLAFLDSQSAEDPGEAFVYEQISFSDSQIASGGQESRPHGGGSPNRRGYIIKGQRYWLDDRELAVLIAQMLNEVKRADVQEVKDEKPQVLSRRTWLKLKASLKSLESLADEPQDDDEDDELLLLLM